MEAMSIYWQILLDQQNTSRDARFLARADAAIAATEAWVSREPGRAEAWFYLGAAYGARVQLRGMRGQLIAAARDGKRIHDALQRAVKLEPDLHDAYFGLGLYHYYAAIAPTAARMLRWLLLLPGGDRVQGLSEMVRTQNLGQLLRGEADYQLHLIYLWYERQQAPALRLAETLRARYPHNPVFAVRVALTQSDYFRDAGGSLRTYQGLLDAAQSGSVAAPGMSEVLARLGLGQQLANLCRTEQAIDQLQTVIAKKPAAPYSALANAHFLLGTTYDRAARRGEAVAAYRAAAAAAPPDDPLRVRERAQSNIRRAPARPACR
jgi:tetratricopeptide (TPR) repeat protein